MKIRLLNDGGFHELSELTYPKEVEATRYKSCGFDVPESEFGIQTNGEPFFFLDSEVEVVE